MGVEAYSTNPDANTQYMPEGQLAGTVNNGARGIQADIAEVYNDPGWWRPGAPARTITRISTTAFREPGVNVTSLYHAGRRVRIVGALTGTIYGAVSAASYTGGNTDVTVDLDSGSIQAEAITVHLSIAPVYSTSWLMRAGEDWRGIVELATAAEALTGTDTVRAITPATLAAVLNPSTGGIPNASTSQKGIVELATSAEAIAGTDTARAVTPAALDATLDARAATTSETGLVELATSTETRTGSDATRAMTPAGFAANGNNANPGSMRLPGGQIVNFGSATTNGSGLATVTYDQAFGTFAAPLPVAVSSSHTNMVVTASAVGSFSVLSTDAAGNSKASVVFVWASIGY